MMNAALNAWYYGKIAAVASMLGKHEISAEYWIRVADLKPRDAKPLAAAAHCKSVQNRNLEAETLLRKSVDVDPTYAPAWFNLGFLIQKRNDHAEAMRCFDQAIRHDPKLDRAFYGKALSHIALDQPEEAKASLQKTIELQPMSPYGYYQLAALHHRLGDDKACIKLVKKLATFEPKLAVQLQTETGVQAGVTDPFARYHTK